MGLSFRFFVSFFMTPFILDRSKMKKKRQNEVERAKFLFDEKTRSSLEMKKNSKIEKKKIAQIYSIFFNKTTPKC